VARRALKLAARSWVPWYAAFVVAANILPELAYALLAAGAAVLIVSRRLEPRLCSPRRAAASALAIAAAQAPLALLAAPSRPSPLRCAFAAAAAVCEELFFRGALLPDLGLLPQAFAFALAHTSFTDPVSLVESALLAPHYLLLGVALGLTAEACGYPASALAHALYNLLASLYTLPLDAGAVAALVLGDLIPVAALAAAGKVEKRKPANPP
jgi:membrane protease YdiL (CAAX protease family)